MTAIDAAGGDADLGGARGILASTEVWRSNGRDFALVVVAETEGSTYRKPGAFAAIAGLGERRGVLSGGCLETGIEALAMACIESGHAQSAEFDTRTDDDLVFGSGSGCRGRMRVVALPVKQDRVQPLYDAILEASISGGTLRVAMAIDGPHMGECVTSGSGCAFERFVSGSIPVTPSMLRDCEPGRYRWMIQGTESDVAVFDVRAPRKLLLFGAGPEAAPLLRFARALGWFTFLVDHRQALLDTLRPQPDHRLQGRPPSACAVLDTIGFDAAIAMTHLASADLEALEAVALRPIPYVGLLGPASRRDALLDLLDGHEREVLEGRLHAPVGLALGGDGPESIALSIVADLQRHFAASR